MLDSLLPYYERELGLLRELSSEFGQRYPKIAGRLQIEGDQCEDPHTERLIESFAFLTSRIHKKLDDEYPEISASFLEVLYPHYLRPIPATTIVQFECDPARPEIAKRYQIERGQLVQAPAIQGVACKFRSSYPVNLYPLSLIDAQLNLTSSSPHLRRIAPDAAAILTLTFNTHGNLPVNGIGLDDLRFFLDGEPALMHLLYEQLLANVSAVRVSDGSEDPALQRQLPASCIQPVGFGRDEGILEYDARSFLGYRLLTEYFSFPDKFLFIDITQLGAASQLIQGHQLTLDIMFKRWPDTERHARLRDSLQAHHLRMGCTPIVNLFVQQAEPIRVTHQKASYAVLPDARKQQAYEVIQIRKVTRVEKTGQDENCEEVLPFYALRHGQAEQGARFYWHASRESSPRQGDKGSDLELHLVDMDFQPVRPAAEVLSLELLCSNRDLPELIPFGGNQSGQHTDFQLPGHSVVKRVKLLRKPSSSLRAPAKRGLQWRLISHLSLNYLSLVDSGKNALQEMLGLYNLSDSAVNTKQIQGIAHITSAPAVTRITGKHFAGFARGTEINLTLSEEHFVGGSVYLFASVLERFFALYCAPNSFTQLKVHSQQHKEEIAAWPARAGEALVI
ncbi:type VI secretion system baseplate subunit TssF [Chitinibacter sp. ZOR0017]|uniref:type VI secretion system baseplate subunit TssF n=1 Tax=Chitinibacter sp. ZOR0017 TaxID=1339254 RepID=UPI0006478123|nr:type VI secretion system baseplate subunit TssF [Chitinibacter sp. ZOR0017]